MRLLETGALEVSRCMSPNDPLLMRLWHAICVDNGYDTSQMDSASREEFLSNLPNRGVFSRKGKKASISRWFSFQHAHFQQDVDHHSKLLVGIYVGIKCGWLTKEDDVWKKASIFHHTSKPEPPPGPPQP
eukprot:1026808-Heterocapsa_arctica.AAC.1